MRVGSGTGRETARHSETRRVEVRRQAKRWRPRCRMESGRSRARAAAIEAALTWLTAASDSTANSCTPRPAMAAG